MRSGVSGLFCRKGPIAVLANREPIRYGRVDDGSIVKRSASGLVAAREPLIEASAGVWGRMVLAPDSAVVDPRNGRDMPPASPVYQLRRVVDRTRSASGAAGFMMAIRCTCYTTAR
jgi:hypothetical protein